MYTGMTNQAPLHLLPQWIKRNVCAVVFSFSSFESIPLTTLVFVVMATLCVASRFRIVHLAAEGLSYTDIAKKVNCNLKTVSFWVSRLHKCGSTKSLSGSGRPVLLDVDALKRAVGFLPAGYDGGARIISKKLYTEGLVDRVAPGPMLRSAKAQAVEDGYPLICRRGRPPK